MDLIFQHSLDSTLHNAKCSRCLNCHRVTQQIPPTQTNVTVCVVTDAKASVTVSNSVTVSLLHVSNAHSGVQ